MVTSNEKNGQYLSINLAFALGVIFGIFASRGVSGKEAKFLSFSLAYLKVHRIK